MALRVVQKGSGATRPLVLAFLVWPFQDKSLRSAFGPDPCIVADDNGHGKETLGDLVEYAHSHSGLTSVSRVALIGYSAGCQRVRTLRLAGANAAAYLLVDGTHASWPPQDWQIAWLKELANKARRGEVLLIATHTLQVYTEGLTYPETPFASTLTVLRLATGFALDKAGPVDAPVITRDGDLWVYSYKSAPIDAKAHSEQASIVLPRLAGKHLGHARPLVEPGYEPDSNKDLLGDRAVARSLAELTRGARENPPGSDAGPDIKRYFSGAVRNGKPLGLEAGDWCAAAACWAAFVDRRSNEVIPHEWRASGLEIQQDAESVGCWRSAEIVRSGKFRPARGDLVIWRRGTGWQRHVARIVDIDGATFRTVGANENDGWKITQHDLGEPQLLGFVDYRAKPLSLTTRDDGWVLLLAAGLTLLLMD